MSTSAKREPAVAGRKRPSEPVALVTGASRGIGAAVAEQLARRGARLILCARGIEGCQELAAELGEGRAVAVAMDVGTAAGVQQGLSEARRLAAAHFGSDRIDWLVNNAGFARSVPLAKSLGGDRDEFEAHLAVNFHGAVRLTHGLLPGMRERGYGAVVNVASSAGLAGYGYVAAYCASKHALVGYTRAAAIELERDGVFVHAVCPHYVDTPMLEASIENMRAKTGRSARELREHIADQNPGGELLSPGTVAEAVLDQLEANRTGVIWELAGDQRLDR